ncbi:MAG: sigma 54-interacting transcriptional regulator [Fusobacteriaceae bacterium]|jgi:transcriptional regulator with PAS, ATPase and Fis domain|nr:sigma 54-interacting transcriptional regulator [Fusobacteriaceae bacterium]
MEIGLILTHDRRMGQLFVDLLHRLFEDALHVNTYYLDEDIPFWNENDRARVVITSSYSGDIMSRIPVDRPVISASLTFQKQGLLALERFPAGTRALLVNTNNKTTVDTAILLYQKNIHNINFIPYSADSPPYLDTQEIEIAVTPGEPQLVPPGIKRVVDIGDRMFDVSGIIEIAAYTGLEHMLQRKPFLDYNERISGGVGNAASSLPGSGLLKYEYDAVMKMINIGILGSDAKNYIYACNNMAEFLLGKKRSDILYLDVRKIFPEFFPNPSAMKGAPATFRYENTGNRVLDITVTPMFREDVFIGAMFMLLPAGENETLKSHIVSKFMQKGHQARYRFEHIIGRSAAIRQAICLAQKMAVVDFSVLITGQSGVGKEIFAQSIHNASRRFDKPFVAINCAAIPDSLLESELFGYEGGSFTGAKKQGKTGLFEAANNGTFFFDEIEELSPHMQAKLLRAIQERQIMKVGGDSVIEVDVRIICAANQDLLRLVRQGKFREDLYYRISTLPLELPPLKERENDLFLILDHFCHEIGASFILSAEARKCLAGYSWPGNIRELRNCVEYLHCLKTGAIERKQLPPYVQSACEKAPQKSPTPDLFKAAASVLIEGPCGRGALRNKLQARGIILSEAQVRTLLKKMKQEGWVQSSGGRGGSSLTVFGREAL